MKTLVSSRSMKRKYARFRSHQVGDRTGGIADTAFGACVYLLMGGCSLGGRVFFALRSRSFALANDQRLARGGFVKKFSHRSTGAGSRGKFRTGFPPRGVGIAHP